MLNPLKNITTMKKMILALIAMMTLSVSANAMSYEQARNEALFLTDKMAYELNLTDAQYEAAYEINLDYLMSVANYNDVFGTYWERRNLDLSYILYSWQWDAFRAATYFYRPLYWDGGYWHFGIYARYPRRDYFYFGRPHFYATYRGGHSWHMNGGRSFYHSRADHFRPALSGSRAHFGMRNSFDRGDYRGSRGNSSTRITAGQNHPSGRNSFGASRPSNNGNNGSYNNGHHGNYNNDSRMRSNGVDRSSVGSNSYNGSGRPNGVGSSGSSASPRSNGFGASRSSSGFGASRNSGNMNSAPSRSMNSAPTRSSGSMGSSHSSAPTRSSGSFGGGNPGGGSSGGNHRSNGGFGAHR